MKQLIFTTILFVLLLNGSAFAQADLTPLFAQPTAAEIEAVLDDWNGRDVTPRNWQTVGSGTLGGFTVDVVSHDMDGGNTHYGFVRHPADYDPNDSTQTYGILTLNHGGIGGVGVGITGEFRNDCLADKFLVVPSFRGETLFTGALGFGDLLSEGEVSEFDGDIDDVLALVNGTIANYAGADGNDQMVFGGSRGGAVSYLQSLRDPRIGRAVYFFGATDHFTYPDLQETVEQLISRGQNGSPFYATVVNVARPYQDGTLTLEEARHQLLMRSAIHFIDRLPDNIQVHHGAQDNVVPVSHSQRLDEELTAANLPTGDYAYYEYPDGEHGNNMPDSGQRRNEFLCTVSTTEPTNPVPMAVTVVENTAVSLPLIAISIGLLFAILISLAWRMAYEKTACQ